MSCSERAPNACQVEIVKTKQSIWVKTKEEFDTWICLNFEPVVQDREPVPTSEPKGPRNWYGKKVGVTIIGTDIESSLHDRHEAKLYVPVYNGLAPGLSCSSGDYRCLYLLKTTRGAPLRFGTQMRQPAHCSRDMTSDGRCRLRLSAISLRLVFLFFLCVFTLAPPCPHADDPSGFPLYILPEWTLDTLDLLLARHAPHPRSQCGAFMLALVLLDIGVRILSTRLVLAQTPTPYTDHLRFRQTRLGAVIQILAWGEGRGWGGAQCGGRRAAKLPAVAWREQGRHALRPPVRIEITVACKLRVMCVAAHAARAFDFSGGGQSVYAWGGGAGHNAWCSVNAWQIRGTRPAPSPLAIQMQSHPVSLLRRPISLGVLVYSPSWDVSLLVARCCILKRDEVWWAAVIISELALASASGGRGTAENSDQAPGVPVAGLGYGLPEQHLSRPCTWRARGRRQRARGAGCTKCGWHVDRAQAGVAARRVKSGLSWLDNAYSSQ
ncbi:hypothetical protein B0H11DRAFT_1938330 [Mycena galericulata]|nr:hypothetical protein B0H11DRAFT_1938330 [Mycena galericulata]